LWPLLVQGMPRQARDTLLLQKGPVLFCQAVPHVWQCL